MAGNDPNEAGSILAILADIGKLPGGAGMAGNGLVRPSTPSRGASGPGSGPDAGTRDCGQSGGSTAPISAWRAATTAERESLGFAPLQGTGGQGAVLKTEGKARLGNRDAADSVTGLHSAVGAEDGKGRGGQTYMGEGEEEPVCELKAAVSGKNADLGAEAGILGMIAAAGGGGALMCGKAKAPAQGPRTGGRSKSHGGGSKRKGPKVEPVSMGELRRRKLVGEGVYGAKRETVRVAVTVSEKTGETAVSIGVPRHVAGRAGIGSGGKARQVKWGVLDGRKVIAITRGENGAYATGRLTVRVEENAAFERFVGVGPGARGEHEAQVYEGVGCAGVLVVVL